MGFNLQTKRLVPRTDISGIYISDLGSANTVHAIAAPEGAKGVILFFMKSDESAMIRGRVGFAGEDNSATLLASDTDDNLGHHQNFADGSNDVGWSKVLHVACSTGNAKLFGSWCFG